MKVALVYDRVNKWGGAERVLLALHELFPDAPLYTSVYNAQNAQWANEFVIKTSFLQNLPFASTNHELLAPFMPVAFESFTFDEYDLVISVTSESAKGIITKPHTVHISYILTPTRYLWSGYNTYFSNNLLKILSYPAVSYLKAWDVQAAQRPDVMVAISGEVKQRIKRYYGRDSEVVYAGVTLNKNKKSITGGQGDYFLVVSRLSKFTSYKRVDLAIKACNKLGLPLKIVGTGSWEGDLKQMAGPTVEFLGNLTDEQLSDCYHKSKALIFPGLEDFGLTIIEAQGFGKPVIAFKGGGALETIVDGKTGILFEKQTVESLVQAIKQYAHMKFDSKICIGQAEKFSQENFKKNFLSLVNDIV